MADRSEPVTGYPAPQQPHYATNRNGYPPPSNTAYLYASQPPHSNPYYPDLYDVNRRRSTFLRRFIISMIAFFAIFLVVFLIIWLVFHPQVPEFRIDSLVLTNFSISGSQEVTGNWHARFQVYNPNKKMSVGYDDIETSIFYHNEFLSHTRIAPFYQDKRNQTAMEASYWATNSYMDQWVVDAMNKDKSRGSLQFNVKLLAVVGFRSGSFRHRRRYLSVLCRSLDVGGISSNNVTGHLVAAKQCAVGFGQL